MTAGAAAPGGTAVGGSSGSPPPGAGPADGRQQPGPAGEPAVLLLPPAPRGWRAALAAGVFPPMLLGFTASALANRLVFAGWALAAAIGYTLLLRGIWAREGRPRRRAGWAALWLGLAFAAFAGLVLRHHEILDLGYRALLWPVYAAALTRPLTWWVVAAVLAVGGGLLLATGRHEAP
ncbi:MAG TPA: hypothetical protein VMT16_04730 [Thermoanaerobaculia bacterium]|nr:hypothetical protein [Thermoanaerobaculia bacterium]